jgi:phage terminase large subunit GpA-like protein
MWQNIEWPPGEAEAAAFRCPHCNELIGEEHKPQMVTQGRWRATAPGIGKPCRVPPEQP